MYCVIKYFIKYVNHVKSNSRRNNDKRKIYYIFVQKYNILIVTLCSLKLQK